MRKLFDNIKASFTLRPQSLGSGATNGTGVDTQGYNDAMVVLETGAVSGTSPTLDVKLQESDDNSTFADISGATFTQVTAANSSQVMRLAELNVTRKRYIRAVGTVGGSSTPTVIAGVEILLGQAASRPVNSD
jgi:hypothetical protein